MFLRGFSELGFAVFQGAFHEQVVHLSACVFNPIQADVTIDETQYLDFFEMTFLPGPVKNQFCTLVFAFGNPCGCNFNTVYIQILQEEFGNVEFFTCGKRYARGLFSIPQGGIHDGDFHDAAVLSSALLKFSYLLLDIQQVVNIVITVQKTLFLIGIDIKGFGFSARF